MERSWTTVDKAEWGPGPWQDEPDQVVWVDEATDLDCMIRRGPPGGLCGYVGVPRTHPWYGAHYAALHPDVPFDLSWGAACDESNGICHEPEPGREHDLWWLGFAHGGTWDLCPRFDAYMRELCARKPELGPYPWEFSGTPPRTYKHLDYVRAEVRDLAQAAAAV